MSIKAAFRLSLLVALAFDYVYAKRLDRDKLKQIKHSDEGAPKQAAGTLEYPKDTSEREEEASKQVAVAMQQKSTFEDCDREAAEQAAMMVEEKSTIEESDRDATGSALAQVKAADLNEADGLPVALSSNTQVHARGSAPHSAGRHVGEHAGLVNLDRSAVQAVRNVGQGAGLESIFAIRGGATTDQHVSALAAALNPLGLGLFRSLSASNKGNVVISPLSVKMCLSMVASGATKGSVTETEMTTVLGDFAAMQVDSAIDVANSAWVRGAIKAEYLEQIQKEFGARAFQLADADPEEPINKWVKESTRGRIEKLFDELDPLTVMVLVNTVFFKGSWAKTFDATQTQNGVFRAFDEKSIPCDMMYKKDKNMIFTELDDAQVVRLPYASGGLSATIFLPRTEGPDALDDVVGLLTPTSWAKVDVELRMATRHVELRMPRFKIEFGESLKSTLEQLGMPTPFEGEASGAFLGMSDDALVHISEVMHKATIEVNEEGTVASAATGAVMATRSMPPPSLPMTIDRPFLFLISDSDGAIMFVAKVSLPSLSGIGATL